MTPRSLFKWYWNLRLEKIVRETRNSYEIRRFRKRRAAAKLGLSRKAGA